MLYPTLGILWEAELDRRRAEPGLLPRLQPLDRRFLPHVGRPADPDRASVARRSGGGRRRARARGEGRLPRRLCRALHLDAQGARRSGARCDLRQGGRARRADRHPSRLRAVRIALAALRERPSPVAARLGDGRRRRAPGLHHLLRLRHLRPLPQAQAGAAGIAARAGSATGSTGSTASRPPPILGARAPLEAEAERLLPPPGLDLGRSRRAHPARR